MIIYQLKQRYDRVALFRVNVGSNSSDIDSRTSERVQNNRASAKLVLHQTVYISATHLHPFIHHCIYQP